MNIFKSISCSTLNRLALCLDCLNYTLNRNSVNLCMCIKSDINGQTVFAVTLRKNQSRTRE